MAAVVDPIPFYVGDDWVIGPVTMTTSAGPVDLTGATIVALFYGSPSGQGVDMVAAGNMIFPNADLTQGRIDRIVVPRALTGKVAPRAANATTYPVRTVLAIIGGDGYERTRLIIRYSPSSARLDEGDA